MNYLAHFHLSHGNDDLMTGALLGDFVKGPLKGERSQALEQGILLHRKIDAFTDRHQQLNTTQQLFDPIYRRYAAIMTDVVFDHFLNRHWQHFHPQPLTQFSQQIFTLLTDNEQLAGAAQRQAEHLSRYDVFIQYQHWQTVESALLNIGRRIQRNNPLATAADEMLRFYPQLEQQFLNFYPELQRYTASVRQGFVSVAGGETGSANPALTLHDKSTK